MFLENYNVFSLSCCQPDMRFYWARLSTDSSLAAGFGDVSLWGFQLRNQKEYYHFFVLRKSVGANAT